MTFEFRKHLLSELHMVVYRAGDPSRRNDRLLSLEHSEEALLKALKSRAGDISGHLILRVLRTLSTRKSTLGQKRKTAINACDQKFQQESYRYGLYRIESGYNFNRRNCQQEAECRRFRANGKYLAGPRQEAERKAREMVQDAWEAVDRKKMLELLRCGLEKQGALKNMQRPHLISNAHVELDTDLGWALYDPANCFFPHELTRNTNNLFYGYVDMLNGASGLWDNPTRTAGKPGRRSKTQSSCSPCRIT